MPVPCLITYRSCIVEDAERPISTEERNWRWHNAAAFATGATVTEGRPEWRVLMSHSEEFESAPAAAAECANVIAELIRRRPGAVEHRHAWRIYDFTGELELCSRWHAALARAAEAVERARPPLGVAAGDFIEVEGCALRVSAIDLKTRTVTTERLDASGQAMSSIPMVRAESLRPLTPPFSATQGAWPECPRTITDGLGRARWGIRVHVALLERAGLIDED